MLEDSQPTEEPGSAADTGEEQTAPPARKTAARKAPAKKAAAKKTTARKTPARKAAATAEDQPEGAPDAAEESAPPAKKAAARKTSAKKASTKKTAASDADAPDVAPPTAEAEGPAGESGPIMPLFKAPEPTTAPARKKSAAKKSASSSAGGAKAEDTSEPVEAAPAAADTEADQGDRGQGGAEDGEGGEGGGARRRRRRGGRRRRKSGDGDSDGGSEDAAGTDDAAADDTGRDTGNGAAGGEDDAGGEGTSRRRRRRRRSGEGDDDGGDDPQKTVTRTRKSRSAEDQITAVTGSTRLEAKKQRRREGREAGRRRAPIVSEAEFLARRESVDRVMVIRQRKDLTQIAVLEDKVLVEHYVARESQTSLIGNIYLGRVQNVLPSMEAAFIDIGKGRNAVLYAGEVNWSALGHKDGQPRKIESVLSSGQSVLVQVTKDPVGHKGARLTSQISIAGRFLVYVPDGTTSGISRKLPDTERTRLKTLLKEIVPDTAGVIVRTAAEGASEAELTRDVERLKARWEDVEKKAKGSSPQLLYGEPDLTLKVVRDLFTEDFSKLVIQGEDAWETVQSYVGHVAPDLEDRLERFDTQDGDDAAGGRDVFATYRIDEQIAKGLDRKVWLPSGGSLVIDRTEAMTVVDVNTGKFTGSGGNLEETVTKNNLEAAEEIVRQLRLRDIGGIIVVDFIDMVLESNRDLVLRRLVECLGRDRTRHQVAEVTSLGLVQMTRKRIGTGLLEAFSETCEHCQGRGVVIHDAPVEPRQSDDDSRRGGRRGRGRKGGDGDAKAGAPSPKDVAAMARADRQPEPAPDKEPEPTPAEPVETPPAAQVTEPEPTPVEPVETPPAAQVTEPEPTPVEPVEPVETPPAAPVDTSPRRVTRTRRSASRPAGATSAAPAPIVVTEPEVSAPTVPAEPAAAPEKPRVVTRTRARTATRPAGPPVASDPSPDGTGAEPGEPGEGETQPVIEHVPVKKRGPRKR